VTGRRVNGEMIELFILAAVIACIVWILWRVRTKRRAAKAAIRKAEEAARQASLDHAWQVVLNDPNYLHRRRYEERMRDDEMQARKEEGL